MLARGLLSYGQAKYTKEHDMNLSMQIGRGLTGLALCALASAYVLVRPAAAAPPADIPMLAAVQVSAPHVVTKLQTLHRRQRCEASVVVGAPIALRIAAHANTTAGRIAAR